MSVMAQGSGGGNRLSSFILLVAVSSFVCLWNAHYKSKVSTLAEGVVNDKRLTSSKDVPFVVSNNIKRIHPEFTLSTDDLKTEEKRLMKTEGEGDDSASPPLCERNQVIQGKWVPEQLDKPPYVTPTVHLRCYPHEFYYKNEPWDTWKWQPSQSSERHAAGCEMSSWDRATFCDLLKGATVSIVGDSLSWEHYSSLIQLNGKKTKQGYQHQSRELQMNIYQSVCNGQTRVLYRRDDKLLNLTASLESDILPTVLILNRGAHYVNDTVLLPAIRRNLQQVREWMDTCRTKYKMKCHFFWRTSVPGHPECGNFSKPVNDLRMLESRVSNLDHYDERSIRFHWYDYQHQNELVLKELEKSGLDYRVIDAYYLNMRRPDEHRAHQGDCLHNCYPGKMDVYSQLMLHYLRMDRTKEDVDRTRRVAKKYDWRLDETTKYDEEATEIARKIRKGEA